MIMLVLFYKSEGCSFTNMVKGNHYIVFHYFSIYSHRRELCLFLSSCLNSIISIELVGSICSTFGGHVLCDVQSFAEKDLFILFDFLCRLSLLVRIYTRTLLLITVYSMIRNCHSMMRFNFWVSLPTLLLIWMKVMVLLKGEHKKPDYIMLIMA